MKDTYRHKGLRKKLVDGLRSKGIADERILQAFMDIPRHFFIDEGFADWAYKDVPFKIDADQTISQPYTVAFMTALLDVKRGDKVLEVGTGSGFQACVLSYLGAKVYSIERQEELFKKTGKFLEAIGFDKIRLLFGDGYKGYPRYAPYDKIIVTAGAPMIPTDLVQQLAEDGILVIPVNKDSETQSMVRIIKKKGGKTEISHHGEFRFVPLLPGLNTLPE